MSDALYWIWLSQRLGAGNKSFISLLKQLGDPFEIFRTDPESLYGVGDITEKEVQALSDKSIRDAQNIMETCSRMSIGIVTYDDEKYPKRLKNLMDPPMVLYYRGKLPAFDKHLCIAIVGTRTMSDYGQHVAFRMGYELSSAGVIVVSGMALGIDGVATCGALTGGGMATAVMGCGLDRAYPPAHVRLMNEVIRQGVAISEYPPGEEPDGKHFPVRNRIISGLCQGVVVIEGDQHSGALITAEHALYQGRAIFATPGNVGSENSEGPNQLLRDGAHITLSAEDVLNYFDTPFEGKMFSMESYYIAKNQKDIQENASLARMNVSARAFDPRKKQREKDLTVSMGSEMRSLRKPAVHTEILIDTERGRDKPALRDDRRLTNPANHFGGEQPPVPASAPPVITRADYARDPAEESHSAISEELRTVLKAIPDDRSISLEKLMQALNMNFGQLNLCLINLEAKGYISSLPGNLFVRN